jgi:hypothetical protein
MTRKRRFAAKRAIIGGHTNGEIMAEYQGRRLTEHRQCTDMTQITQPKTTLVVMMQQNPWSML